MYGSFTALVSCSASLTWLFVLRSRQEQGEKPFGPVVLLGQSTHRRSGAHLTAPVVRILYKPSLNPHEGLPSSGVKHGSSAPPLF